MGGSRSLNGEVKIWRWSGSRRGDASHRDMFMKASLRAFCVTGVGSMVGQ